MGTQADGDQAKAQAADEDDEHRAEQGWSRTRQYPGQDCAQQHPAAHAGHNAAEGDRTFRETRISQDGNADNKGCAEQQIDPGDQQHQDPQCVI